MCLCRGASFSNFCSPFNGESITQFRLQLSSCHGFAGYRLALQDLKNFEKNRPYYLLIGPQDKLITQELLSSTAELYRGLLEDYIGLPASIQRANKHIKRPAAHHAYTYGASVLQKFDKHGMDDKTLFAL